MQQLPGTMVLDEVTPVFGSYCPHLVLASQFEVVAPAGEGLFSGAMFPAAGGTPIGFGGSAALRLFGSGSTP
jgi:hypothetical protein